MIKFFSKTRSKLLAENRLTGYLLYAGGEILLVVVGILIALQVNEWETDHYSRTKELKYLNAIKQDLKIDLKRLSELVAFRKLIQEGNNQILKNIEGEPIRSLTSFTKIVMNSVMEETFSPNNITYTEMVSSGNLNLIRNDSIRLILLELEVLYKANRFKIDHETFDYWEYISKPFFRLIPISKLLPVFAGQKTAEEQLIKIQDFNSLLKSQEYRNGIYVLSITGMNLVKNYENTTTKSKQLIRLIEKESQK